MADFGVTTGNGERIFGLLSVIETIPALTTISTEASASIPKC